MRRLSPDEVEAIFGAQGFSVSLEHAWYRSELVLEDSGRHIRVGGQPPMRPSQIPDFVRSLTQWLPAGSSRLLWVDHWDGGYYGTDQLLLEAACRGLEDARQLEEAPGFFFETRDWSPDPFEATRGHAEEIGLLVGLAAILIVTGSDGWVIAEGSKDRVEFWEGNVFFHSERPARINEAEQILGAFRCPRELI